MRDLDKLMQRAKRAAGIRDPIGPLFVTKEGDYWYLLDPGHSKTGPYESEGAALEVASEMTENREGKTPVFIDELDI